MKKFNKTDVSAAAKIFIFKDFRIKLICFFLAIAMFFSISMLQRSTKTFSSRLKTVGLKDYLVIANEIPDTIKIIARDKPDVFNKITEEDFNIRLDLSAVNNTDRYRLNIDWDIPPTMNSFFSTVKIEPKSVTVNIDRLSEKDVSIIVNMIGNPLPGYVIKQVAVDPPSVRIQGPESLLADIDAVKTETINIDGIKDSFTRKVNLTGEHKSINILGSAFITFEIMAELDTATLEYQEISIYNLIEKLKGSPAAGAKYSVTARGSRINVENLTKKDIELYVDCSNITSPGEYSVEIKTRKPKSIDIISIEPEMARVQIEKN